MKKFLFSLCFFSFMIVGAQAQKASCGKPCTKSTTASASSCHDKAPSAASTTSGANLDAAAKLASMDASIETRTDPATGNVSYVRKETCSHSGSVSYVDVSYDATTNTFVNVSPSKTMGSGCGTKATSASGKACCTSGAAMGKSCCAGKAGAKSAEKVKS